MQVDGIFKLLPWSFLLAMLMLLTAFFEIPLDGIPGYIFFGLGLAVMLIEFSRSTDIRPRLFLIDLMGSIAAVIAVSVLFTLMLTVFDTAITFHYYFGASIIIADSLLSPYNGFRTALRNFGLGSPG